MCMAKYRIEYSETFEPSPLSRWVHQPLDSDIWSNATEYQPKFPSKVIGKGYLSYIIEHKGIEFIFRSKAEIDHCISIFEKKVLPTTHELAKKSWMNGYQHIHWLSKWPGAFKSFKDREAIIRLLKKVKNENT